MSITWGQAEDLVEENWGDWSYDDPDWWADMVEMLMEYPSVKALRRSDLWRRHAMRLPNRWPGAKTAGR